MGRALVGEDGADLSFARCHFRGNEAVNFGGAIWCHDALLTLANCTLCGNRAGAGGGSIRSTDSQTSIANCTGTGNRAPTGAFLLNDGTTDQDGRAEIDHCTIAEEDGAIWNRCCVT